MPYCRSCGKQVPEDAKFCPYCGAQQVVEIKPSAPSTRPPLGLSIISIYLAIVCAIDVAVGILFLLFGLSLAYGASTLRPGLGAWPGPLEWLLTAIPAIGLMSFGLALLNGVAAYGLWSVRHWGWTMAVTLLVAGTIMNIPTSPSPIALIGVVFMVINIVCLVYLSKGDVRKLFQPASSL
jgi:hypothetical protein